MDGNRCAGKAASEDREPGRKSFDNDEPPRLVVGRQGEDVGGGVVTSYVGGRADRLYLICQSEPFQQFSVRINRCTADYEEFHVGIMEGRDCLGQGKETFPL